MLSAYVTYGPLISQGKKSWYHLYTSIGGNYFAGLKFFAIKNFGGFCDNWKMLYEDGMLSDI